MYSEVASKEEARIEILRRLPNLKKIDGEFVKPSEIEAAQQIPPSEWSPLTLYWRVVRTL